MVSERNVRFCKVLSLRSMFVMFCMFVFLNCESILSGIRYGNGMRMLKKKEKKTYISVVETRIFSSK